MDTTEQKMYAAGKEPLWLLGDIAPLDRSYQCEFKCGLALANMEGPIFPVCEGRGTPKAGPSLRHMGIPGFSAKAILSIANNHMMDFGVEGLERTRMALRAQGVMGVGAGNTEEEARAPIFLAIGGLCVAILACCERQFGAASPRESGVAVLGFWVFEAVRRARAQADAVIVSVHAGVEMLPWPEAWRQDCFRALVDAGANVVHGHHSHVPQAFEEYNGALITYGLGNCVIDPLRWRGHENTGWSLAFEVMSLVRPVRWRLLTLVCEDRGNVVVLRESSGGESERHNTYVEECNKVLENELLIEGVRQHAALELYERTYAPWMKWPTQSGFKSRPMTWRERWIRPLRALRESVRGESREWISEEEDYLLRYHLVACDSHRSMIALALGVMGGEVRDMRTPHSRQVLERHWAMNERASMNSVSLIPRKDFLS